MESESQWCDEDEGQNEEGGCVDLPIIGKNLRDEIPEQADVGCCRTRQPSAHSKHHFPNHLGGPLDWPQQQERHQHANQVRRNKNRPERDCRFPRCFCFSFSIVISFSYNCSIVCKQEEHPNSNTDVGCDSEQPVVQPNDRSCEGQIVSTAHAARK